MNTNLSWGRRASAAVVAMALLIASAGTLSAVDLGGSVGVSDHGDRSYVDDTAARVDHSMTIGVAAGESFYFKLELASSDYLGIPLTLGAADPAFSGVDPLTPISFRGELTAEFVSNRIVAGISAGPRSDAASTRWLVAAFGKVYLPLFADILEVDAGLRAATDFAGYEVAANVMPAAYLPLARPLLVAVDTSAEWLLPGFDGAKVNGLLVLRLEPQVSVSLSRALTLNISGGYTFDLFGGYLPSYPFYRLGVSLAADDIGG